MYASPMSLAMCYGLLSKFEKKNTNSWLFFPEGAETCDCMDQV